MLKKALFASLAIGLMAFIISATPEVKPAEKTLTITLPVEDWNTVLNGLGELPAKVSNPVINKIQIQAAQQLSDTVKPKK